MVKNSGSFVEPASVPRVREAELLVVEMMAELVAQRAEEFPERSDFLPHSRSHPDPNQHGFGSVVTKKFGRPLFTSSQRPRGEYAALA
jgi:hypothetical protein